MLPDRQNHPPKVLSIDTGDHRARVLAARDALVTEFMHLVEPIAQRIKATLPPSFDLDDLISTGYIALIHAATGYRPDFPTQKKRRLAAMPFDAYAKKKIRGAMIESVRRRNYTANTALPIDDSPELAAAADVEQRIDTHRIERRVRMHVSHLPNRLQAVIALHYFAETPLKDIAAKLDISERRVSKLHADAIAQLKGRVRNRAA